MPKRSDLKTILIIGAGPIVIGQACEFDYSGAQACKALRDEGYRVVLVNSNPATIMTDPDMADAVYIEPINWQMVEKIIAKERPDALLPTMGGQTALNCALDLADNGVLEKYNVELIGAKREAIMMAEQDAELETLTSCSFGAWLSGEGQAYLEVHQLFDSIAALHAQMHALADRLLAWRNAGRQAEALAALAEFRALDMQLLAMLDQFAHTRHGH